ncbi:hypothetical protein FRC08_008791 [Ceratobasidium sp. 394]|nr:hypothetical protein FRC08_008791 [Ceratobasidium sp. 394]
MYFALLPLLLIAATLQEPLFDYLNYYHAANVAGVSSWFLASGSVLQVLRGTVTYVEMRVQGQIQSRFPLLTADVWMTIRLEDAPFTYFSSIFAVTSDSSASAVYGRYLNLSASEFEPTRPFSAVTPIRGLVNRLPASVTAPAFPPPTMLAAIARLENRHTPNSTDPSHYPQPTGDANSTSSASIPTLTPLPVLASSSNGGPSSRQATNSYGKFETTGQPTIIVAQIVVVASTSGVSQSLPSSFPPGSHIHTVATLVQLATSTSVPVISPADYPALFAAMGVPSGRSSWVRQHAWILLSALLVPIQLVIGIRLYLARRRRTETGHSGLLSPTIVHHPAPAPEEAERSDLLELRRLREELGDLLSIIRENGISPAQLREYVKLVIRTRQSVYGIPTDQSHVPSVQEPSVRRSPSTRAPSVTSPSDAGTRGTPNPPGGFAATAEDSSQAIDSAPRRGDSSFGSDAPVASCSVKRRKSVVRASGNLSPRAHKSLTRTSGVSMGEVSPASEPSRSCEYICL